MSREELIAVMVEAVKWHEFDVSIPDWAIRCTGCDWFEEGGVSELHDAHRAGLGLDAVEHLIRADALWCAADDWGADGPDDTPEWLRLQAERLEKGTES